MEITKNKHKRGISHKYLYLIYLFYLDNGMTNMTLAIPEHIKVVMRKHSEIRWSKIARDAIAEKVRELEMLDEFLAKKRLEEKEAAANAAQHHQNSPEA